MSTPVPNCPQPDYPIRERAYTPAQMRSREYAAIQALADRRRAGKLRADERAWSRPSRPVTPRRRHDDAKPMWPEYLVMLVFSISLAWGLWALAAWILPLAWNLS